MPETSAVVEEREAPLRALAHADLLARLDRDEQRMRAVIADVLRPRARARSFRGPGGRWPSPNSPRTCATNTPCTAGTSLATTRPALRCWPSRIWPSTRSVCSARSCSWPAASLILTRTPTFGCGCARTDSRTCSSRSSKVTRPWSGPTMSKTSRMWNSTQPPGSCSSGVGAPMITVGFAATWHSPISPGCRPCCPDTDQPGTASADQLSQATERSHAVHPDAAVLQGLGQGVGEGKHPRPWSRSSRSASCCRAVR